jgi:predicted dehydrogenase
MSTLAPLRLGVVGAGRFAEFVAGAVADLADVRLVAVADAEADRARRLAGQVGARAVGRWQQLVVDPEVDAVVVASTPDAHAEITLAALAAGRHVFCEKPLATEPSDAARVREAAARTGRAVVVDHVLRYNPVLSAVARLQSLLGLGAVRRLAFENDASDEDLPAGHWFWDERRSGGIFVEHGVHSFDAAHFLLGSVPEAVQATTARRPGSDLVDVAVATTCHPGGAVATFAHSFTHARRCERQLMRLDFGTAEARISGWIPVAALLDIWTDDAGAAETDRLPGRAADLLRVDGHRLDAAAIRVSVRRQAGPAAARGRGIPLAVPHRARIEIDLGGELAKARVYAESVRAAMVDFGRCASSGAAPAAGPVEGWASVVVAAAARESAHRGRTVHIGSRWAGAGTREPAWIRQ